MSLKNYGGGESNIVRLKETIMTDFFIYLDGDIEAPNEYRSAFEVLREAKEYDTVTLVLNTGGGDISTAIQFYNAIQSCKAETIADVYVAYSAGSMIMLSCDKIIINDLSSVMIHSMSTGISGKTHEMDAYTQYVAKECGSIISLYKGFLNDDELKKVVDGKDYWMDAIEARQRLKNWIPIKQRTHECNDEEN